MPDYDDEPWFPEEPTMTAKTVYAGSIRYIYNDQDEFIGTVEECRGYFHAASANGKALGRKTAYTQALALVRAEAARQAGVA